MIEREEEQPVVKVTDKRKFNFDGTVREGVEFEAEKPKETVKFEIPQAETAMTEQSETPDFADETAEIDEEEIPGADDPASFINFLSTLATNAAASLGAVPHPATGQRSLDLDTGKYWLDVLAMLSEKTKGNLHPQESRLFEGLLTDLRMQYVQLVRMTEEKLKAQAAQKFSAGDILGKK